MLVLGAKEQAPTAEKKWLRSHEVKQMLSISTRTLQNLGLSGTLHPKKIGGINFYSYAEIEKLLRNGKE